MNMFRVELDVVVGKHQGTAAEAAAEDIQTFRFTIVIIIIITIIMIILVLVDWRW